MLNIIWNYNLPWWRHQMETFLRYWPFVEGIHRSPLDSLTKASDGARTNGWANNRDAGDLRRHRAHYDVTVMCQEWQCYFKLRCVNTSGQIKMTNILQTTFWNGFSWMEIFSFWLLFRRSCSQPPYSQVCLVIEEGISHWLNQWWHSSLTHTRVII